ncbi:unnamed protein product [Oncorhynchus mykiss]|uniref:Uncharacterized protein n=1 Tax=Oncorhynchus mykiss TaxID=8022 RepID=A0A060X8S4_ONCMY|nr:unnamed protein product [Oncorhynchus mykiss]
MTSFSLFLSQLVIEARLPFTIQVHRKHAGYQRVTHHFALNNLQSTNSGFGYINSENVFKVCDKPHPLLVKSMLEHCQFQH